MPDNAASPTSQIAELKVSAHTMALDPGLYCVFSAPGGPAPESISGLPAVRITAAPGKQAGAVELVGLDPSGWIGPDAATLVRVGLVRSELLVTVYQARDSKAEAPQLQVVRISGAADDAPKAAGAAPPARGRAAPKTMDVVAHIYGMGDVGSQIGEWSGVPGSKRWIEGFGIAPSRDVPMADIEYQAVLGRGWLSPWSPGGQFCGSRGMSLPILGLRVRLRGDSARTHGVALSATFVDGTKVGPVHDGEPCEAPSLAALEAFQVLIQPASSASKAAAPATKGRAPKPAAKPVPAPAPAPKAAAVKAKRMKASAPAAPPQPAPKAKRRPAPAPVAAPVKPARGKPSRRG